jgi:hypothetical protein
LYRAIAIDAEGEDTNTQIGISDKFWLIHVIFFEELHDKVMMSEEAASRADLEVGLVGHKSPSGSLYI